MLQSDKERAGVHSLLQRLPAHELRSLAETIAGRLVRLETRDEATSAVMTYAMSAMDVLRRKKMKKEYIFQYLNDKQCTTITSNMDKIELVRATLKFWESDECQGDMVMEEDMDVCMEAPPSEIGATAVVAPTSIPSTMTGINNNNNSQSFQRELESMSHQFVTWFYPLLNNGHVAPTTNSNDIVANIFGPQLFWRDCSMKIFSPEYEQLVEGNEPVARSLLELIGDNQLYFNPFDAQRGIRCQCEPHGLVLVLVGGTVHRGSDSVGIFEQKFGLIRDPTTDNMWKIKHVELQLNGKDLNMAPDYHQLALEEASTSSAPSL